MKLVERESAVDWDSVRGGRQEGLQSLGRFLFHRESPEFVDHRGEGGAIRVAESLPFCFQLDAPRCLDEDAVDVLGDQVMVVFEAARQIEHEFRFAHFVTRAIGISHGVGLVERRERCISAQRA